MRLYLSSFRLGTEPEHLVRLAGEGAHVAVIANAIDDEPTADRLQKADDECRALRRLGLSPVEVDLHQYFGADPQTARQALAGFEAVWLRGGNVFVLRRALAESAFDTALRALLAEDALVYAGYSAGPCVLAPSLDGLEAVDAVDGPNRAYGLPPLLTGLGILDRPVVPHCNAVSPLDDSTALDALAERYDRSGKGCVRLRDGQALVIDGDTSILVGHPVRPTELLF